MCDIKSKPDVAESFKRELELVNSMLSKDEDTKGIATLLNNLSLDEKKPVVYGPLNEAYYNVSCPFVWSDYTTHDGLEDFVTKHFRHMSEHEDTWHQFFFSIYCGFVLGRLGMCRKGFECLQICDEFLKREDNDEIVKVTVDGLNHCIQATRAHMHFLNGDAEMADDIISTVVPLKELNNPNKAALISLNTDVMKLFGLDCKKMALEMMKAAIKIDPDDEGERRGIWYYKAGRLHGRIRKTQHRAGMPSQEELQMLERAVKINPLPISLATLGDVYREASAAAAFNPKIHVSAEVQKKMLCQSKKLYKEAIESNEEKGSVVLRCCGNGFMKLPHPHKDIKLAKHCLQKAIEKNPYRSSAYQALGTLEEKHFKNLPEALKYFKLSYDCGNPISGFFIIQVQMKINRNFNPINNLDEFINDMGDDSTHKAEFLLIKGEYYFFKRNVLLEAAKVWKEAITLDPNAECLTHHVCRVLQENFRKPYLKYKLGIYILNIYKCLEYEINMVKDSPKYSDEDKVFLQELFQLCQRKERN